MTTALRHHAHLGAGERPTFQWDPARGGGTVTLRLYGRLGERELRKILEAHAASRADITVAATPVTERDASEFGILQIDGFGTVVDFVEKPHDTASLSRLALSEQTLADIAAYLQSDRRLQFNEDGLFRYYPELDI